MLLTATLMALLVAAPAWPSEPTTAVAAIPDEPGATVLPDASILQTLVADLDSDGVREIVRLVVGDDEAVLAEVWGSDPAGWQLRGEAVEVVPPARIGTRIDPVYQSTPVRALVRHVAGRDHVTLATQPHFEEIDVGPPCCLLLNDLVLADGRAVRRPVSGPTDNVDGIIAIDFDGDGTDELLSTHSLSPQGDIGYPIEARVHRWTDGRFEEPTLTRIPVGSGDSTFRLGDSDGLPGEEAAIVSTLGQPGIFRIRLGPDDGLLVDSAGFVADQAVAVAVGDRRGVAAAGPLVGLVVAEWPAGQRASAPVAQNPTAVGRIVGPVTIDDAPRLVVAEPSSGAIHLLGLPDLLPPQGVTITRSPAAASFGERPVAPFSGPIPGGGVDGEPAVIHAGRLFPSPVADDVGGTSVVATLAGAQPVGIVRDDGAAAIVLDHGGVGASPPRPEGGALVVPARSDAAWTSIAPIEVMAEQEADDGAFEPPLRDARVVDGHDGIAVGRSGFVAQVSAPPGSRVVIGDFDPSVVAASIVVPASGTVNAPFVPPMVLTANPRYRATLLVLTPAGHAYAAEWDVRVLTEPPEVDVTTTTPFASGVVAVDGTTESYATVRVGGRPVQVAADGSFTASVGAPPWPSEVTIEVSDELGNVGETTVSVVGLFDYRGLPWALLTAILVGVVAVAFFLRVPHSVAFARPPGDDAALEELDGD